MKQAPLGTFGTLRLLTWEFSNVQDLPKHDSISELRHEPMGWETLVIWSWNTEDLYLMNNFGFWNLSEPGPGRTMWITWSIPHTRCRSVWIHDPFLVTQERNHECVAIEKDYYSSSYDFSYKRTSMRGWRATWRTWELIMCYLQFSRLILEAPARIVRNFLDY